MINQNELPGYMEKALPELSAALCEGNNCSSPYRVMNLLKDYTQSQLREGNLNAVKKSFLLAEKLYNKGNTAIKNAIECVYVYSFSHILFGDDHKKKMVLGIIPVSLYTLYVKQMLHSHI